MSKEITISEFKIIMLRSDGAKAEMLIESRGDGIYLGAKIEALIHNEKISIGEIKKKIIEEDISKAFEEIAEKLKKNNYKLS